ncbi:transposase [Staphylococcus sp. GDY8P120P]|uniref:transposase n=1 Tax=Staphylococcus sp. GDY8P120P TaxID=2804156 RepID=UPI001AEC52A1|nr:transposase [Staphylococcus sp. GDY8P120P]
MTTRNYYSPEQKAAIAALYWDEKQTLSQISRENKISISVVRRWVREYSPAVNDNGEKITKKTVSELEARIAELEQDNQILREAVTLMDKYSREQIKKSNRR